MPVTVAQGVTEEVSTAKAEEETTEIETTVAITSAAVVARAQQAGSGKRLRALLIALCVVLTVMACILAGVAVKFYRQLRMTTRRKIE